MRTSKFLLSKKKIELFLITTNLQFQHHIVLIQFLHCRFFVNLCSFRYLLLAFAVGVTDIAVDFRLLIFIFCCTHYLQLTKFESKVDDDNM